ncbi:MAG TPA: hypothetical protein EYQ73_01025 [Candidatus Poseidoniales archaeon]|jgi:hypothetical protein|nr:MAG: hypothetical protein CXT71_04795 [Euryarchaeota archaeon]HIF45367.1 hypothetical protein [Candidatus Poseidoniales archaeon]HIL66177.1 hypothetical protein [Candidatus Poseidoniales archaeon]
MSEEEHKPVSLDDFSGAPPRNIDLPSAPTVKQVRKEETLYHDLEILFPDAPVPRVSTGLVLHRAVLHDLTGIPVLLDWLADGDAAIVQMEKLMERSVELDTALFRLNKFIEGDLNGQIVRLTDTRLMLLPPGCRGVRGVENEAFAEDVEDLGQGGFL